MTHRLIALVLGSSFMASAAFAGSDFDSLDTDGSGGLSLSEVQAAAPSVTAEEFAAADADGSGELSQAEFEAWKAGMSGPSE